MSNNCIILVSYLVRFILFVLSKFMYCNAVPYDIRQDLSKAKDVVCKGLLLFFFAFIYDQMMFVLFNSNTVVSTSGTRTAYPPGTHTFTLDFQRGSWCSFPLYWLFFNLRLWLHRWYLQTLLDHNFICDKYFEIVVNESNHSQIKTNILKTIVVYCNNSR